MKQILTALLIAIFFLIINLSARGQDLPFPQDRYSILGEDRNAAYEDFASTETTTEEFANEIEEENTPQEEEEFYEVPLSSETKREYQLDIPTTTATMVAGAGLLDYLHSKKFFEYNKAEWNEMRERKEKGLAPGQPEVAVSTGPVNLRQGQPSGLAVELPYESQLSISGRKLIGTSVKATLYDQPLEGVRNNSTVFSMDQQLQIRIKGTVGKKVNVDVNFDDTTTDKRDISVVYKGDSNEFVQEAAFGDINMSLPSTEFVGYSKQLFGIKMDTKYKGLRTKAFFSQTKGLSEVKRFNGNSQFTRQTISDSSYIPMKYYYALRAGISQIRAGTVKVYRADFTNNLSENIVITTGTVLESFLPSMQTFQGNFVLLVPGRTM